MPRATVADVRFALLGWAVLIVTAAYVARTLVVVIAGGRWPGVAAFVEHWWGWAPPLVALLWLLSINPVLGLIAGSLTILSFFSPRTRAIYGPPFRPRR